MFQLDQRLENDTIKIGQFRLSYLLMMNDRQFPWYILVPEVENIKEIFQLENDQRKQLTAESHHLSLFLNAHFQPDKLNIAAIGNIVPQLHIHHIVRYDYDKAWPEPIWGKFPRLEYSKEEQNHRIVQARANMNFQLDYRIDG